VLTKIPYLTPPSSSEIELRFLSALIHLGDSNNLRVQQAMLQVDKDCFYNQDNRVIYDLVSELFAKGKPFDYVDFITLVPAEQYHITELGVKDEYMFPNHLEHDTAKLVAYRTLRKQIKILTETLNLSLEQKLPEDSLEVIRENIQALSNSASLKQASIVRDYAVIADDALSDTVEDSSEFSVDIPGLPPVPNRALIMIAGRSGHGKTFFALHLMDKIIDAHPDKQSLYFNLEMHERVMMERHARLIGVHGSNRIEVIRNGLSKLLPKNVSLVSVPLITIDQIEAEARLASLRQPLASIVVDYIGLVGSKSRYDAKHLQQSDIAKRLAALSLELDCVVIGLIQVNRDFKNRAIGERCPRPEDASESMGSVYSSSWWLGIDQPQLDDQSGDWQDMYMVECRKNRGDSGLFSLKLKFKNARFFKYERPFCAKRSEPDGF
jgi:replicative DNA helicase